VEEGKLVEEDKKERPAQLVEPEVSDAEVQAESEPS
jgi:hypothetical protein